MFGVVLAVAGHPAGYPGADAEVGSVDRVKGSSIYTQPSGAPRGPALGRVASRGLRNFFAPTPAGYTRT